MLADHYNVTWRIEVLRLIRQECVYAGGRTGERQREGTKAMSHHAHMFSLLCITAQSQSPYRTIYSNQAVTFSSTPAGTSFTLCAVCMNTPTHIVTHFLTPCLRLFSGGKHYKVVLP